LQGEAGGKAIIWGGLERGRVHENGEADADLGIEAAEGGDGGGAEIEGGDASIGGGLAEESIGAFGFAGEKGEEGEGLGAFAEEVKAWATVPGEVIGVAIGVGAEAAPGELEIGLKEEGSVTEKALGSEDAIVGAGSEGEIVAMDATFWGAFDFHLMEFFGERAAVTGGKF